MFFMRCYLPAVRMQPVLSNLYCRCCMTSTLSMLAIGCAFELLTSTEVLTGPTSRTLSTRPNGQQTQRRIQGIAAMALRVWTYELLLPRSTINTPINSTNSKVVFGSLSQANPTCSVAALQGCEGLWSFDYGHA